jgi:hypothetical protein
MMATRAVHTDDSARPGVEVRLADGTLIRRVPITAAEALLSRGWGEWRGHWPAPLCVAVRRSAHLVDARPVRPARYASGTSGWELQEIRRRAVHR